VHRMFRLQMTSCPADVTALTRNSLGQHDPGVLLAIRELASRRIAALRRRDAITAATNATAPAHSRRLRHAWPSHGVMHKPGLLALEQKRLRKLQLLSKRQCGRSARRVLTHKMLLIARNKR
jgi:hypothetical protein